MTVETHPTAEVAVPVPRTAEPDHAAAAERRTAAQSGAAVGRRALKQLGDNPLLAVFGAAVVALLIFTLTVTHDSITRTHERITPTIRRRSRGTACRP